MISPRDISADPSRRILVLLLSRLQVISVRYIISLYSMIVPRTLGGCAWTLGDKYYYDYHV